jgi:hypothetical protein
LVKIPVSFNSKTAHDKLRKLKLLNTINGFYSSSRLKHNDQCACRDVTLLGHIFSTPSQSVLLLNSVSLAFGFHSRQWIEPMNYHTELSKLTITQPGMLFNSLNCELWYSSSIKHRPVVQFESDIKHPNHKV